MTKFMQNRPPDPHSEESNLLERILTRLRHPSKKVTIISISGLVLGVGGYWGLQVLVKKKLPPFLEQQISNIIDRPIELGAIKNFSLTGIRFGATEIPATATDPDYVAVEEVKVGFNLLPLVFRRTLPINATLVQPKIYAEQEQDGKWINLDFLQSDREQKEPLLNFDVSLEVEEGDITAVPYGHSPLEVKIDGKGRYNPTNNTHLEYDLEAAIAKAKATIQGETVVETGKTDTKLLIKNLALADLATLIPKSTINLNSGNLNADLDINIPSFEEIDAAKIKGILSLQELSGTVKDISAPIKARSQLNFRGTQAHVEQTQASIGNITAQLAGKVNWQDGYDLAIDVLPFRLSSLEKILPSELPVNTAGEVTAKLQITGDLNEPVVQGKINNTQTLTVEKSRFNKIQANFTADLDKFVIDNLQLNPLAGGKITAEGTIVTNLKGSVESGIPIDFKKMLMALNFNAQLPTEATIAPYYQFPSEVTVGTLKADGEIRGTIANPEALITWQIPQAATSSVDNISGAGEIFLMNQNLLLEDTKIEVGEGSIKIEGSSDIEAQTWRTDIQANSIALTPFLTQLQLEGVNLDRPVTINTANTQLQGKLNAFNLNKIQGLADVDLDVDGGKVAINSKLNRGAIQANAITNNISVGNFIPNLPIATQVKSARVDVAGKLQQLLSRSETPNLSSIDANLDANLSTADGTLKATGKLINNQWQTNINADDLNTNYLLDAFVPNNQFPDLDNLKARVDLSGSISPLLNNKPNFPLKVNQVALQTGNQSLGANGDLLVTNLFTNPDVANADLDINAQVDFDNLPVDELLTNTLKENQLVAKSVNLSGDAKFQGNLQGKNLISAPARPGNISLTGNLRLENFAFNDAVFDPAIAGEVIVKPGETIALDLRGQQDVIAATFEPCTASRCRLPYLPTRVELSEGKDTDRPIIARGEKQGDLFALDIVNFPLSLLNLAPGQPLGIKGALDGEITGEVEANLYTLATRGEIEVDRPAVGYIQADNFNANFNYDPDRNIAEVNTASLNLGKSQYNFQGGLNLQSGELDGKLNIPQAYIQDVLTALRWFTLEDLTRLFQTPDYAESAAVDPNSIITVNQSIAQKLNQLRKVENQIQAIAEADKSGNIPAQLDIQGSYRGEIDLNGTITNPQAFFKIEGNDWQWQPQLAFADIVPPLGFIKEETQFITINELLIQGNYQDEKVNLDTATVKVEDTILALAGQLSAEKQNANYQVKNLSVDTIGKFVNIPFDLAGVINTTGTITGTLLQPEFQGQISFAEGAFNGRTLPTQISGNYIYEEQKLKFKTSEPSSIQVDAIVPYPIQPGKNDRIDADVQLTTEAFSLLDAFTQNNLTWISGEGTADLQASGRLDLNRDTILYDLNANGEVNLDNATLKNPYFQEPLVATGKVSLNNQIITVETLNGKFADKDLSVTGSLPILSAVANLDNPLTVKIPPGKIDVKELYKGEIEGEVIVTSAALSPVIGGRVSLSDGRAFIPKNQSPATSGTSANLAANKSNKQTPAVVVELQDFQVNLEDFKLKQSPLYEFEMMGDLNLNGALDDLPNLQADGTIHLTQGNVDWLSNYFSLVRSHDNLVVFKPEAGILNPYLQVQMKTDISDFEKLELDSQRQLSKGSNEIPDPLSQSGNTKIITVNLSIDGEAKSILPSLGKDPSDYCSLRPNDAPLTGEVGYSQEKLNQLAQCVDLAAFADGGDRQLLNSPAVELSSTPARSQGEIVSLLGNSFIGFAEELKDKNGEELLELGVAQFVITPIQRRLFNRAEDAIVNVGKKIGLDYLRVYPFIEGIYEFNQDSSIRGTFNYVNNLTERSVGNNEFKVEYQLRF